MQACVRYRYLMAGSAGRVLAGPAPPLARRGSQLSRLKALVAGVTRLALATIAPSTSTQQSPPA